MDQQDDYADIINTLNSFINFERTGDYPAGEHGLGTMRMEILLQHLNNPEKSFKVIHIAGTKGKGSIANYISQLLIAYYKKKKNVGLFTSPHIQHLLERIQVNGEPVKTTVFCSAAKLVFKYAKCMELRGNKPTYFEVLTAIAYKIFEMVGTKVAVIEVGVGGRLDATNVSTLQVAVSVISTISRDHMEILGNTLEEIAKEKAGIIRNDTPLVLSAQSEEAERVIRNIAKEKNAQIKTFGKDFNIESNIKEAQEHDVESKLPASHFFAPIVRKESLNIKQEFLFPNITKHPLYSKNISTVFSVTTWKEQYPSVTISMLGEHQKMNAAAAIAAVTLYLEKIQQSIHLKNTVINLALNHFTLPARIESIAKNPWIIIDGAHNIASAWALSEVLTDSFAQNEKHLIFAVAEKKEWEDMLNLLLPIFKSVTFTSNGTERSVDPNNLAAWVQNHYSGKNKDTLVTRVEYNPVKSLGTTGVNLQSNTLIVATGSLYLAGTLRDYFVRNDTASSTTQDILAAMAQV